MLYKQLCNVLVDHEEEIINKCIDKHLLRNNSTTSYLRDKFKEDMHHHIDYLCKSILLDSIKIFEDYMNWVLDIFKQLKLSNQSFEIIFDDLRVIVQEYYSDEEWYMIEKFFDVAKECFSNKNSKKMSNNSVHYEHEASMYIDYLLKGNRKGAFDYIVKISDKVPIEDIYVYIFQESMYRIGRLWQRKEISVATEHYCSASTQFIMTYFYPEIFKVDKNGYVCVSTCIEGELHEIGIRMISDILELEGFRTYYLGANTPLDEIVNKAIEEKADLIAISTILFERIDKVVELIGLIRSKEECKHMKIIVGGSPFNIDEDLWSKVGADGYAKDAINTISLVMDLVCSQDD